MGIRKFLDGINPEACNGLATFKEDRNGKIVGPNCPLAHAAYLHDNAFISMFPNWGTILSIASRFSTELRTIQYFTNLYDHLALTEADRRKRLILAINETELACEDKKIS